VRSQVPERERLGREAALDDRLEQSFPAGDPPSTDPSPDSDTEKSPRRESEVIDMAESTIDHSIVKRIEGLVHEDQDLYAKGELADRDQLRLEPIKIELDQCWDLVRQREARREFGQDPNVAKARPPSVVERYKQ
jgi:hypothetical protein